VTDEAKLSSFRLADSFLPTGTHTASYGLEQFIQADRVTDADDLRAVLGTYLRRQVGPSELVALRTAHAGTLAADLDGVCTADRQLIAVTLPSEFRESARSGGARLLSLQRDVCDDPFLDRYAERINADDAPGSHAVVVGVTTALSGIDEREACLLYCHEFVTGLLGAGQRLLSLGHTDAQRLLDALQPVMIEVVDDSADRELTDMASFTPLIDVLAAEHERAQRRLFVS
jgi:urease accessory protein